MDIAYNPKENDCQERVCINVVMWQLWETGALVAPEPEVFLWEGTPCSRTESWLQCHCIYGIVISFINLKSWEFGQQLAFASF